MSTIGKHLEQSALIKNKSTQDLLTKLQALAGVLFSIFLVLHLSNTILAIAGAEAYTKYQTLLQGFYQHPFIETILIGLPLAIHASIGTYFLIINRKVKTKPSLKKRLHTWAGIFLLVFLFGHIAATRGIGLLIGSSIGFGGISFSLWWIPGYFYPYYFLLFISGLYHGYNGLIVGAARLGFRNKTRSKLRNWVMGLGALSAILSLLAFGGILFENGSPVDNDYARFYSDKFGVSLKQDETDD